MPFYPRCSLQRRNQKLICEGGVSLLIKNIRTSENCPRALPRRERSRIQVCITVVVKRKGARAQTQVDLAVWLKRKSSGGILGRQWEKVEGSIYIYITHSTNPLEK